MTNLPACPKKSSIATHVTEGQSYAWCSCGLSQKQPFCDGSHKETSYKPILYEAKETKIIHFCGCKRSKKGALCDGSHKEIL
jgi:CDGSH-type Zn-finger protein